MEDLHKKSAKVCHKHQASNRLEKKASKHKILLHLNIEDQRIQECHNKSFIITKLQQFMRIIRSWTPWYETKHRWKRKTVCHKTRNLKHRCITQKPEWLLKLYSRELRSTIDRYKNGENAYIYSKQQQQRNQEIALKSLHLHGFWHSAAAIFE